MTIEQLFIILFASFGLMEFTIILWQAKYVKKLREQLFFRQLERSSQRRICRDCHTPMLDEWYCPKCEGLYGE